jgi:hypothetical protein
MDWLKLALFGVEGEERALKFSQNISVEIAVFTLRFLNTVQICNTATAIIIIIILIIHPLSKLKVTGNYSTKSR